MPSATQILRKEHDTILEMLDALEAAANRIDAGNSVPQSFLADFHEFFSLFADRCHHGKEEDLLFPLLERKGVPRVGGPVGCMLAEHDEGRGFVKIMARNAELCAKGDLQARKSWTAAARSYANLLRNHIWKENEILFLMAERLMSPEEQAALAAEFARVEEEKLSGDAHARLHGKSNQLVRELAALPK